MIPPLPYIYLYTVDNGCMHDLDPAMFYALLQLEGKATALKLKKKASMKCLSWLLMGFGKK